MYMLYQQYTTAIKETYANHPDLAHHLSAATSCREWLESLEISPQLRNALVEPIQVLEEAFNDLSEMGA